MYFECFSVGMFYLCIQYFIFWHYVKSMFRDKVKKYQQDSLITFYSIAWEIYFIEHIGKKIHFPVRETLHHGNYLGKDGSFLPLFPLFFSLFTIFHFFFACLSASCLSIHRAWVVGIRCGPCLITGRVDENVQPKTSLSKDFRPGYWQVSSLYVYLYACVCEMKRVWEYVFVFRCCK